MTKLLLVSLKIEYETTDITLDNLCLKHKTTLQKLKGYETWTKQANQIVISEDKPIQIVEDNIKDKIATFKTKAIDEALRFMEVDVKFCEVKEFKDIVSIVDSIDKSFQKTSDTKPTINILVQNLVEKYKDDC